jgi:hypothetical protein
MARGVFPAPSESSHSLRLSAPSGRVQDRMLRAIRPLVRIVDRGSSQAPRPSPARRWARSESPVIRVSYSPSLLLFESPAPFPSPRAVYSLSAQASHRRLLLCGALVAHTDLRAP